MVASDFLRACMDVSSSSSTIFVVVEGFVVVFVVFVVFAVVFIEVVV